MNKQLAICGLTMGIFISLWSCAVKEESPKLGITNVVFIGVDGMSPDGIANAQTPMIDSMIEKGASTMHARAVLPSSSSPNWASMIMGADTEQHGITSNGWEKFDHRLPPVVVTENGTFPSIFTLFKDQQPDALVGAIYDWDGFGRLFEKNDVGFDIDGNHEDGTTSEAVAYLKEHKPKFTFIHLDHVDHAGHSMGHGSKEYYNSVKKADSLISEIVEATKIAGNYSNTMFIVTADHGGIGFGHGGESPAEMTIPFIMFGKGIKKGYEIEETVNQIDNAPTVAYALGLETPQAWIGRPVISAFVGHPKPVLKYKRQEQVMAPKILPDAGYYEPSGGIFKADSVPVIMQNPNSTGEIRYVVDSEAPTLENSKRYEDTFYLKSTSLVKAAVFQMGQIRSTMSEGNFRIVPKNRPNTVSFALYDGDKMEKLPDFSTMKATRKGNVAEFSHKGLIDESVKEDQIALVLEAKLMIEEVGQYQFFTNSDDGSRLYLDGELIVDNDGNHGVRERSGSVYLEKGLHLVKITYYNGGGGYHLDAKYQGPSVPKQIIPADKLF